MKILYGTSETNIDVTEQCHNSLKWDNRIFIPNGDFNRAFYFTDPVRDVLKKIFIVNDDETINEYSHEFEIIINTITGNVKTRNVLTENQNITEQLLTIHGQLNINGGSFVDEFPEQKMAVKYLTGSEKVLEIGGNIGRNSLVIGHILGNNSSNFVSLESNPNIANKLIENRNSNNMAFNVENAALSNRALVQKGWETKPSDVALDGWTAVNTMTLQQLNTKYNIVFDTLVLDCEGAFYYILMDMPEILTNIKLIIMENDYHDMSHKHYIDSVLRQNNFYRDYWEKGGWGVCYDNFYEVWKKEI